MRIGKAYFMFGERGEVRFLRLSSKKLIKYLFHTDGNDNEEPLLISSESKWIRGNPN